MSNSTDIAEIIRLAAQIQKSLDERLPSSPVAAVVDDTMPTATRRPSFGTGPFIVGMPITRVSGEYSNATPVACRRSRDGVVIPGSMSATYAVQAADVGAQLVFEELVVRNDTKKQAWFKSDAVIAVAAAPPLQ